MQNKKSIKTSFASGSHGSFDFVISSGRRVFKEPKSVRDKLWKACNNDSEHYDGEDDYVEVEGVDIKEFRQFYGKFADIKLDRGLDVLEVGLIYSDGTSTPAEEDYRRDFTLGLPGSTMRDVRQCRFALRSDKGLLVMGFYHPDGRPVVTKKKAISGFEVLQYFEEGTKGSNKCVFESKKGGPHLEQKKYLELARKVVLPFLEHPGKFSDKYNVARSES